MVSSIASFFLGTGISILRVSRMRLFRILGNMYVKIFESIPVLFWMLFFYYILPDLLPAGLGLKLNAYYYYPVIAGIVALTLDNASYVSDILKNGKFLIPQTQRDVAISTGLSRIQQYLYVLLPQMFRVTLPPLGTRMVHNFKNTTLCMVITAPELTWATQQVESLSFRGVEAIIMATVFYFFLSILMASLVILLERYLKIDAANVIRPEG
jgi:polar amino acid transport system permease protein